MVRASKFWLGILFAGLIPAITLAETPKAEPSLFRKSGIRFDICLGRLALGRGYPTGSRTWNLANEKAGTKETLSTQNASPASLDYKWTTAAEQMHFQWFGSGNVELTRDVGSVKTTYTQPKSGLVTLTIAHGEESPTVFKAAHLWHLWLIAPDACEGHLAPALAAIRPDWQIAESLRDALHEMDSVSDSDVAQRREEWTKHISELADSDFAIRQRADRALRRGGISAWSWLARTSLNQLDTEQSERVTGILADMRAQGDDTPQRLAAWMAEDQETWLVLMKDSSVDRRHLAKMQLERLLGRTVEFDPEANEATRNKQWAGIRSLVERN
jgi:hypothetical protein